MWKRVTLCETTKKVLYGKGKKGYEKKDRSRDERES